jgi:glycosyltransferase involved in cell wall biosynthesis
MKVSVVIPCYKRIRFTKFCIPLAIENAGMRATWYLIDDGSDDGTAEFLTEYKKDHADLDIILMLHAENQGISKTHNEAYRAMVKTDSEIFVNCDSDLLVPVNWLRDLVDAMEANPWVGGGAALIANDTNITGPLRQTFENNIPKNQWIQVRGCGGTLMAYRREIFDNNIYFSEASMNWAYEDSSHNGGILASGLKLAIYTGVQAWMVERLVWDDHELIKLKNRHMFTNKTMEGFEQSAANKRAKVPW